MIAAKNGRRMKVQWQSGAGISGELARTLEKAIRRNIRGFVPLHAPEKAVLREIAEKHDVSFRLACSLRSILMINKEIRLGDRLQSEEELLEQLEAIVGHSKSSHRVRVRRLLPKLSSPFLRVYRIWRKSTFWDDLSEN